MIRLLLLSVSVAIVDQNGVLGKPVHGDFTSLLLVDFSDSADAADDGQAKRNPYPTGRDAELHLADPSSLCSFLQESDAESQITCRLRFTRSKFNFNPFGLRFGKRQESILVGGRESVSQSGGKILRALLKPKVGRVEMNQCGDPWGEHC